MPYEQFHWFKDAPLRKILNVEEPTPGHFYWSDLDVDLTTESIAHPERFPLLMRGALGPRQVDINDLFRLEPAPVARLKEILK
jgi:hypothetical protein